ncbi:hypothetical protein DPMN_105157 [Dreissena polymorpha]|uniref:Uncharacterized protein n=1 Tax=Dreissena polymorpha TaxID=45954 RepID=A0A9D4HCU2_DREPO|nr:hypothetical protein DPMN_105157 [Dreissena polymorpha]
MTSYQLSEQVTCIVLALPAKPCSKETESEESNSGCDSSSHGTDSDDSTYKAVAVQAPLPYKSASAFVGECFCPFGEIPKDGPVECCIKCHTYDCCGEEGNDIECRDKYCLCETPRGFVYNNETADRPKRIVWMPLLGSVLYLFNEELRAWAIGDLDDDKQSSLACLLTYCVYIFTYINQFELYAALEF